jgi:lysophospholipase L1-like esterase
LPQPSHALLPLTRLSPAPPVDSQVSVGGTTIHHWVPTDVGVECNKTGLLPSKGEAVQYPPGWIYNGRMNPMLLGGHGLSVRSVLYYQGEADSGENDLFTRAAYECELRGLVTSYRRDFGQPGLPVVIVQLPGNHGTVSAQHDNDTVLGTELATGWTAIQIAQQTVARSEHGVGLVALPDYGCCQLHYVHKSPVADRAANITRAVAFGDTAIDNRAPTVTAIVRAGAALSVDIHLNNTEGLRLMETYHCNSTYSRHGWIPNVQTVSSGGGSINITCCASTPAGHEGLGIVTFAVNATKHPHDYWGGWVPAELTIVSDTLVTATALLPAGVVATDFDLVDLNIAGVGCVLANANGQPLSIVPPTLATATAAGAAVGTPLRQRHPHQNQVARPTGPPPTPPAPCACDVCNDPNPLPPGDTRIRIAAVGDSITRGHPLSGKNLQYNYPCTLQRLLGDDKYVVFNFGAGGHTMLKASPPALYPNKTIWNSTQYAKAMAVAPHIVLIMLGTNDAVGTIWSALGSKYPVDYADMISGFAALPSAPAVYALSSTPLYNGNFAGINQTVVNRVLPGLVQTIAATAELPAVVPVFEGMGGVNLTHHEWFWGNGSYGCHPNMQGYQALASIVYTAISRRVV